MWGGMEALIRLQGIFLCLGGGFGAKLIISLFSACLQPLTGKVYTNFNSKVLIDMNCF